MIGRYEPLNKQGDTRLNVFWFRIIRPDGAHILNVEDPQFIAQDLAGHTGLIGDVDNRIWERYGAAFITTLLSAVASTAVSVADNPAINNAGNAASLQLAQVTAKVLDQQINLAPIIRIEAGSLVTLGLTKDVFLREPIYPHDEEQQEGNP
jgi:type IV secretion system protein VirB10